jgi:hypothetical protein
MMRTGFRLLRTLSFPPWAVPLALLFVGCLSYGLLIPRLGFYWDDWGTAWFYHTLGPAGFHDVWAVDRPLMGWFFRLTTPFLGEVPWHWQVYGLLTRWLSAVSLWWAFRKLWPDHGREVACLALLFLVYPGFRQQSISVTYSNYFLVLAIFFYSLGAMIWALRERRWFWPLMVSSVIAAAVNMFTLEYFIGLEVLRPVALWLTLEREAQSSRSRLRQTLKLWLPFLAVAGAYLFWRVGFVGFRAYQPRLLEDLGTNPLQEVATLARTIAGDLVEASMVAWGRILVPPNLEQLGIRSTLVFWALVCVGIAAVALFLFKLRSEPAATPGPARRTWAKQAILMGALSLFASGWSFWIPKLPLELFYPWDRFTLGMMLGACLLLVGLLEALTRRRLLKLSVVAVAVGFAVGAQFQAANSFRRSWEAQRGFYWNLTWRIPGLEPGTVLLTNEIGLDYMTDNSLAAVINWMYAPESTSRDMPYMVSDINVRLGRSLTGLEEGLPIYQWYRAATFTGSTSQALVVFYAPPGCLRVVDPVRDDSSVVISREVSAAASLSRLDLIDVEAAPPAQLPPQLQGAEPPHSWCYYFEQADLARQTQDWERIVELGEEAFLLDDHPNQAEERIPFIEGYAHLGNWERARQLTLEALDQNPGANRILCHAWERLEGEADPGATGSGVVADVRTRLACPG